MDSPSFRKGGGLREVCRVHIAAHEEAILFFNG